MVIATTPLGRDWPTTVTIGNFDGVHLGHQYLIGQARTIAQETGWDLVTLTFDPHPAQILGPQRDRWLITPGSLKYHYLEQAGAGMVRVVPFTKEFAGWEPDRFLQEILREELKARHVVVGYNFSFGRGGIGNPTWLQRWGDLHDVKVTVVPPIRIDAMPVPVSSSQIRRTLLEGDLEQAKKLLGHPFAVRGEVIAGDHRGRQMGFPTLNLEPPQEQIMPPYGVYVGRLLVDGEVYDAVASWGVRPTFGEGRPLLEVHALHPLDENYYGQFVHFDCLYRLREERRYDRVDDLIAQMADDVRQARQWLATQGGEDV